MENFLLIGWNNFLVFLKLFNEAHFQNVPQHEIKENRVRVTETFSLIPVLFFIFSLMVPVVRVAEKGLKEEFLRFNRGPITSHRDN